MKELSIEEKGSNGETLILSGTIIRGFQSASGQRHEEKGKGTIGIQKPFFKEAGVERVDSWFEGTLNVSIDPKEFKIIKPDYIVTAEWQPGTTETFWLVNVEIKYEGALYPAYVYYPCPSVVKAHPDTLVEVLAEKIEGIKYGEDISLRMPLNHVVITE
jgi:hypothetical protein